MKKINKMWFVMLVVLMMIVMVTGCSTSTEEANDVAKTEDSVEAETESESEDSSSSSYPEKTIQVVIPTGSGGDTDLSGRVFSKYLEEELGVSVVCSNVTGAGGSVGSREVKDSNPDGYTVLWFQYAGLIHQISDKVDFSYIEDFEIAGIGCFDKSSIVIGKNDGKYDTLLDLTNAAKENPGEINWGLSGIGNMSHYIASSVERDTGVEFNKVELGAQSNLQAALMSDQISAYTAYYSNTKSFIESGEFKVLGAFTEEDEHPQMPDAPTMNEMGFNLDYINDKYYYYAFPKGTPQEFVDAFTAAMLEVEKNADAQAELAEYNIILEVVPGEEAVDYINDIYAEYESYGNIFEE